MQITLAYNQWLIKSVFDVLSSIKNLKLLLRGWGRECQGGLPKNFEKSELLRSRKYDRLGHLETEVSEVTSLLRDDVEKVVGRGERIGDLQDRTEDLSASSQEFRKAAVRVKRKACWQNCRLTCIIILVVAAIIAVIVIVVVVEKPWDKSSDDHHKNSTLMINGP